MVLSTCQALNKCCSCNQLTEHPWVFSHPFLNFLVGHSHNTLLGCNPFIAFLCPLYFSLFCQCVADNGQKEKKVSGAIGLNESENSYLHKNTNSTIAALSGENGRISSVVSLGGKKTSVTPNAIFKKVRELRLRTWVISFHLCCVLVSMTVNNLDL